MKYLFIVIAVLLCPWGGIPCMAQAGNALLRTGNALYRNGQYREAQQKYEALVKEAPRNAVGIYNLGLAYYKQKNYDAARNQFHAVNKATTDKSLMAKSFYNIGNACLSEKKWSDAIDAYKKSLRLNPTDQDAKYNLAYAQKHLKDDRNNQKNDNKDKDNNKNKDNDKGQNPPPKGGMNQNQADNMLNALRQQEQNLQKKKEQRGGGSPARPEKDW